MTLKRLGLALASLRLTLAGMAALGAAALAGYRQPELPPLWLAAPLALLALNLLAALAVRPQFRRQEGLLVFHGCLLAIIVLAAVGLMTRFQGRVELVEGQAFDPAAVITVRQGPWHPGRLDRVRLIQETIRVDYGPNLARGKTDSELRVLDATGPYRVRVGDTRPLAVAGYRFVTTFNKGYAVLLSWHGGNGNTAVTGAVHMPAYPLLEWKQQNRWTSPQGQTLELELEPPAPARDRAWTLQSAGAMARLTVRGDGLDAVTLTPGTGVRLDDGARLRFEGLRLWMGYRIDYNPVLSWLFAAAMIGVAGLAWHFWRKLWLPVPAAPALKRPILRGQHGTRSGA